MFAQPFEVAARLTMFLLGERSFRDKGAKTRIVGLVGELAKLFVRNLELVAQRTQLCADGAEFALDLNFGHGRQPTPVGTYGFSGMID